MDTNRKRERSPVSDSNNERDIRPRLEPTLQDNLMNVLQQVDNLGRQIQQVNNYNPEDRVSETFLAFRREIDAVFNDAFTREGRNRALQEEAAAVAEQQQMRQFEIEEFERKKDNFKQNMNRLINQINLSELTHSEATQLFGYTESLFINVLQEAHRRASEESEPDYINRLKELVTVMSNQLLKFLSTIIEQIYQCGPNVSRQLISIISTLLMCYNYLPSNLRQQCENIPMIGPLFNGMNLLNSELLMVQNSSATVTGIYYFLRNVGGIDTSIYIQSLGRSATSAAMSVGQSAMNSGSLITNQTVDAVINLLSRAIGDIIPVPNRINIEGDMSSTSTTNSRLTLLSSTLLSESDLQSISSQKSSNTSITSSASHVEVGQLLETPVENGGVNIGGNMAADVVRERLQQLLNNRVEGQDIDLRVNVDIPESQIPTANLLTVNSMPVANVIVVAEEEPLSQMSDVTVEDGFNWRAWLWGSDYHTNGDEFHDIFSGGKGKRHRKSRRHLKSIKTRRGRKGKKPVKRGRMTKKGRKAHKTLKRYKNKIRR